MKRIDSLIVSAFAILALAGLSFTATQAAAGYGDGKKAEKKQSSIVEIAAGNDQFSTLVAALEAADLVGALQAEDQSFTVFAPTNAAFAKLPAGTLESLLEPENKEKLQAILLYHVASGKAKASDVVSKDTITTLQGQQLDVQTNGESVMIDNAKVVQTDIMASNGVIHVIDTVVLPDMES